MTWIAADLQARITELGDSLGISQAEVMRRAVALMEQAAALAEPDFNGRHAAHRAVGSRSGLAGTDVKAAIQALAEELGKSPSADEWNAWSRRPCEVKTASRLVGGGSWRKALRAAGLDPTRGGQSRWDNEDLLGRLRDWYRTHGDPPTQDGWSAAHPGGPSEAVMRQRFGSWNRALAAAGLPERNPGGIKKGGDQKRNRQMVTAGRKDVGPVPWDPATSVETIR